MTHQRIETLIHEIRELERAIERFCADADERSTDVRFDFAAIIQWGEEVAALAHTIGHEVIDIPQSPLGDEDPAYRRAKRSASRVRSDANDISTSLTYCLNEIAAIDDPAMMWSVIPRLEEELRTLEKRLRGFVAHASAISTSP